MPALTVPGRAVAPTSFVPAIAVLASAAVVFAPLLRPGYVLQFDMVFAPRMALGADSLGLGSQLPRAVPSNLVVAALSQMLPGDLVQKLVLVGLVLLAGFGAARLAGGSATSRTAAALAYVWTPYFAERLLLGQWAILVGWAALPWLLRAAAGVRSQGGKRRLLLVLGSTGLAGAPALLVTVPPTLAVLAWGRGRDDWRRVGLVAGAATVFSLPWLLPGLLRPGGLGADEGGSTLFAPRSDTPLGVVVGLVTGGGIWNGQAVPPGRDAVVPALGAVVLLAVAAVGVARRRDAVTRPLAAAALVMLALVLVTALPGGAAVVAGLPGGAALRDSQRLVAPFVLTVALGFGWVVDAAARFARTSVSSGVALLALLPVALLPSLAWGVSSRLAAVAYPSDYAAVRRLLAADTAAGAVFVVPAQPYRRFAWNGGRTSLDPLSRVLDRPTIFGLDLSVRVGTSTETVRGEDDLARRLGEAAADGSLASTAAAVGVRWIVVDAPVPAAVVSGLERRYRGPWLAAYRVPRVDPVRARDPYGPYAAAALPVELGDGAALGLLLAVTIGTAADAIRRRSRRRR